MLARGLTLLNQTALGYKTIGEFEILNNNQKIAA